MSYFELKSLAKRADESEGEKKNCLLRELVKKLPEMDALKGVSHQALITGLKLSRKVRLWKGMNLSEKQKWRE